MNLSSDAETVEAGPTVLFRRRDIEKLVSRLEERGHQVQKFTLAPDFHPLDFYVDIPPYRQEPHVKLMIRRFICTSVGIVVRRGR